ncbi:MAG TPA: hypothetical protein VID48_09730 [Solirubrobacteraceae bacterium]|jgi:hypothetical protein
MLFILIPIAWIALVTVLLSILRMAAITDRQHGRSEAFDPGEPLDGLLPLDDRVELKISDERPPTRPPRRLAA